MVELPEVIVDRTEMYQTNYMGFASFTVLIWDHIVTFDKEVEFIWPAKKNLLIYLFFLNRYLTPLGFIVNLFAYLSPVWTPETCSHFIRYEGSMTVIGINVVALMMFIRMKALYYGQNIILGAVAFLGLFSFIMNAYLLTRGVAVVHNPQSGVRACTMIFEAGINKLASSSAWLPLLYDTVVLGLTLYRTFPSLRNRTASYVMRRLFKDGLLYYSVIFSITFVLSIMIAAAPPGIQNITAQLELLMTVAMMSRITISLKSSVEEGKTVGIVRPVLPSMFTQNSRMGVPSNVRIVTPSFDQTKTTDSLGYGLDMSTKGLLGAQPSSGPTNRLGLSPTAILTPNRRQPETSNWEDGDGFLTVGRSRVWNSTASNMGESVWLDTK